MTGFALFGAGRIGKLHAANIAASGRARLVAVYDVNAEAATTLAAQHGAAAVTSVEAALAAPGVGAAMICSSTNTHVDLITAAARAGKAVLCEKPVDLSLGRADACIKAVAGTGVPIMIGFNRRFDPTHRAVWRAVRAGEIGRIEIVTIISRDPAPPPPEYVASSGGLFRDQMIHDFDLARWLLGEEPVKVSAMAASLVDPRIGAAGDVDTALVTMQTASGTLVHIDNSRRASYGYDQRVEVFGERGLVRSGNRTATAIEHLSGAGSLRDPYLDFFLERYAEAYRFELAHFLDAVEKGTAPSPDLRDGRQALALADAALAACKSGRAETIA